MEKITFNTVKPYEIYLGVGTKALLRDEIKKTGRKPLYIVDKRCGFSGPEEDTIVLSGGEGIKTMTKYRELLSRFSEMGAGTRVIVAVGGGTVLDLAGFTASTYMRGIPIIYVPTTLLAMVDASVGGKNGINFGKLKNQVGTIYRPSAVIMDTDFLKKLPKKELLSGVGEIVKAALIEGSAVNDALMEKPEESLYDLLINRPFMENLKDEAYVASVIARAVLIKKAVVEADEEDKGLRHILNYGHTFGHAIEAVSSFKIHHGIAVAMGMVMASQYAAPSVQHDTVKLISGNGLPVRSNYTFEELLPYIKHDKKRGMVIVPTETGFCKEITLEEYTKKLWK